MARTPPVPDAVRALGTIRRAALAESARLLDDAARRVSALRAQLEDPADADGLRHQLARAIDCLRATDDELAAFVDPGARQNEDVMRIRAARDGGSAGDGPAGSGS